MKASTYLQYGSSDVLELRDIPQPTPKAGEVLVEVHAAALNTADKYLLHGRPIFIRFIAGLLRPKITVLGSDLAGRVAAVGPEVNDFEIGESVFGNVSTNYLGAFAEYAVAPAALLAPKPANVSFAAAAAAPMPAVTALQGLRDAGQLQPGQKVLIYGASGGVGTFAIQVATALGGEVMAVCSTGKVDLARALGAVDAIDYTQEDFAQRPERYDLVLAVNGSRSLADYLQVLTPTGTLVTAGGSMGQIFRTALLGPLKSRSGGRQIRGFTESPNRADLMIVQKWLADGQLTPTIDRRYPLEQLPDAMRYLEEGHAQGKIVIDVKDG